MRKRLRKNSEKIPEGKSLCSGCRKNVPNEEFTWYDTPDESNSRTRTNAKCRSCRNSYKEELKILHENVTPLIRKPKWGDPCEACGKPMYPNQMSIPEGVDGTFGTIPDHEHNIPQTMDNLWGFRGWPCKPCNTGGGNLGDTLEDARKWVAYLERAEKGENPSQKELITKLDERNLEKLCST
tara:strand:- start:30 stop:575 length:546 start_codon:yes stop_codon:yes gene_type:complete